MQERTVLDARFSRQWHGRTPRVASLRPSAESGGCPARGRRALFLMASLVPRDRARAVARTSPPGVLSPCRTRGLSRLRRGTSSRCGQAISSLAESPPPSQPMSIRKATDSGPDLPLAQTLSEPNSVVSARFGGPRPSRRAGPEATWRAGSKAASRAALELGRHPQGGGREGC